MTETQNSRWHRFRAWLWRCRIALLVLGLSYVITGVVGIPLAHQWEWARATEWRDNYYHGHPDGIEWPHVKFHATFPVLPGFVACKADVIAGPAIGDEQWTVFWVFSRHAIPVFVYGIGMF